MYATLPCAEKKIASPTKPEQANSCKSGTSSSESFLDLGGNRRVSISEFKGKKLLDFREYYLKDGEVIQPALCKDFNLAYFTCHASPAEHYHCDDGFS